MVLKGTETEIKDAFNKVDANKSGQIDLEEFITAIKSERLMELNLKKVFDKLGIEVKGANKKFENFKKTAVRRRLLKKKMEENVEAVTNKIIAQLVQLSKRSIPKRDAEKEKMYNTLRDTFVTHSSKHKE